MQPKKSSGKQKLVHSKSLQCLFEMLRMLSHNKINKSVSETTCYSTDISEIHIKEEIIHERLYCTTALSTQQSCDYRVLNQFLISLFIKLVYKSNNTLAITLSVYIKCQLDNIDRLSFNSTVCAWCKQMIYHWIITTGLMTHYCN